MTHELPMTWSKITGALQDLLASETYERWFTKFLPVQDSGKVITLACEDPMATVWVENSYLTELEQATVIALGEGRKFKFVCQDQAEATTAGSKPNASSKANPKVKAAPKAGAGKTVKKAAAVPSASGFNSMFTFGTFVATEQNGFACKAAQAIAQTGGNLFNPLFLHGACGTGKTHLLHAIGQAVLQNNPKCRVVYVTGEQFANEFIEASRGQQGGRTFAELRRKYRKAQVLLVDDIQFIAGKEKTIEEFLHSFDTLLHAHCSIVVSANAAACDIAGLDSRLVMRLESGLGIELAVPEYEERLAILRHKRDLAHMKVDEPILRFLAEQIQSNVRRLEGALIRVASFASLAGKMPEEGEVEYLLQDILKEETTRLLGIDTIQKRVAEFFDLKVSDLTGKRRPNSIAFPRQIAMYLSRKLTEYSLKDIGRAFGNRDHGTVIHADRLVEQRMADDVRVRRIVKKLQADLQYC